MPATRGKKRSLNEVSHEVEARSEPSIQTRKRGKASTQNRGSSSPDRKKRKPKVSKLSQKENEVEVEFVEETSQESRKLKEARLS